MTWPPGSVDTRARTARFEESAIRPKTSISPVRSTGDGVRSALVAIGPRADVARGVERVAAERARRPAGGDQRVAAPREGPGLRGRQRDAERVAPQWSHLVVGVVGDLVDLVGVVVVALDDDLLRVLVPRQGQGLNAPVLVERRLQRVGVLGHATGLARLDRRGGCELV